MATGYRLGNCAFMWGLIPLNEALPECIRNLPALPNSPIGLSTEWKNGRSLLNWLAIGRIPGRKSLPLRFEAIRPVEFPKPSAIVAFAAKFVFVFRFQLFTGHESLQFAIE